MTKKDYEAFAAMYQRLPNGVYTCPDILIVVQATADIFARDNERFSRERFLKACGVRPEDIK